MNVGTICCYYEEKCCEYEDDAAGFALDGELPTEYYVLDGEKPTEWLMWLMPVAPKDRI